MPDETTAKPAWTRCAACKTRLWNDRVDIEAHRQHCPADLERDLVNVIKTLKKALDRIEKLEEQPAHVVEVEAGPSLDFEHEAPWPIEASTPERDEEEDGIPTIPAQPPRSRYFDEEEDDEDDEPAPVAPLR